MKRDMDLVRQILLKVESLNDPGIQDLLDPEATDKDYAKITEHVRMLVDEAGLITGTPAHTLAAYNWFDLKLTWAGHDFLDAVRDPEIWARTKRGAEHEGSPSIS